MYLDALELQNFRNYHLLRLNLSLGVNIFVGENAQGKTNILEAICLLCIGKSFRTKKETEMIRKGEEAYYIKGVFHEDDVTNLVEIGLGNGQKKIKINHQEQPSFGFFGFVPVVVFSPEDLLLIKGGPQYRRDFIDLYLAQIEPKYRYVYLNYYKILKQRNSFLKESNLNRTEWEVWNEQLIERGAKVIQYRALLLEKIRPFLTSAHQKISGEKENLRIDYLCLGKYVNPVCNMEQIRNLLRKEIDCYQTAEMERRVTLIGPQRDDLSFSLQDGMELKTFGSQGQQRTAALALKLGVVEVIREVRKVSPLLLLDDVMSEFDDFRKKALLEMLVHTFQTFITATSRHDFSIDQGRAEFFMIQKGEATHVD